MCAKRGAFNNLISIFWSQAKHVAACIFKWEKTFRVVSKSCLSLTLDPFLPLTAIFLFLPRNKIPHNWLLCSLLLKAAMWVSFSSSKNLLTPCLKTRRKCVSHISARYICKSSTDANFNLTSKQLNRSIGGKINSRQSLVGDKKDLMFDNI